MPSEEQIRILIQAQFEGAQAMRQAEESLKQFNEATGMRMKMMPEEAAAVKANIDLYDKLPKATRNAGEGMNMMGNAAGLLKTAIGALGISLSIEGVRRLAEMGAASLAQEGAFKTLAAQAGMSSEAMLNAMRTASDGTISEMELVSIGAKTLATGLSLDLNQMSSMMMLAKDRANAFGIETGQAYETITRAIEYQSPKMLKNMGIILDTKEVYKLYADSIHKSVDALTEHEQQQAFFNAILKQSQGELGNLAGGADKAEDSMKRAKIAAGNLALAFGKELAPAIGEVSESLVGLINGVKDFGLRVSDIGESDLGKTLLYIATNLNIATIGFTAMNKGAEEIESSFNKLRTLIPEVGATWDNLTKSVKGAVENLGTIITLSGLIEGKVPSTFALGSSAANSFAKSIKDVGDNAGSTSQQLEDMKKKAEEIAAGGLKATTAFAAGGVDDFSKQEEARAKYNAAMIKSNAELQAALNDQINKSGGERAKLEQEWQDKIAWVQMGAKERTKEGELEAEAWWNNIYQEKLNTIDKNDAEELGKIKSKYDETNKLAAAQRAKELADQKKAAEERLQVIGLELLSQSGKLDEFFGGVKLSGKEAFDAIKSGVIKMSPELANELSGAMNVVKVNQGLMADNAKVNSKLMESYFKDGGASIRQTFREVSGDVALKYEQMGKDERRFITSACSDTLSFSNTHMTEYGMMGDKVAEFTVNSKTNFTEMKTSAVLDIKAIHKELDDLPKYTDIYITTHRIDVGGDNGDKKKNQPLPLPGQQAIGAVTPQAWWATGISDFIVPPGYPNDSFRVGLTSGEKVNVDSSKSSGTKGTNVTLYFQSLVPPNDYEMARIAQRIRPYLQRQEGRE